MLDKQGVKHGARAYGLDGGVVLVKQTVQRFPGGDYVIDESRERHCGTGPGQAEEVGRAVLDAIAGRITG